MTASPAVFGRGYRMSSQSDSNQVSAAFPEPPFAAIRVIEYGQGVSAAFAAKLLADFGAGVIKVEPPQGDVMRRRGPVFDRDTGQRDGALFVYLNANKRGVVLDLEDERGRAAFQSLLDGADILIHNVAPFERARFGLETPALRQRFPHLVVASISPYGDQGPRAHYRGYDLNVMHASGYAAINPACSPYPELPPAKLFSQQAEFQGGVHAAMAAIAAWLDRERGGPARAIDVAMQECIAATLGSSPAFWAYTQTRTSRLGVRPIQPWMAVQCADGRLYVSCVEEHQWRGFLKILGDPEWGREEIFQDRTSRARNVDALRALIEAITRRHKVRDLYHAAQKMRLPVAPLNRMTDVYSDEQLRARNFFVPLPNRDPGAPPIIGPGAPYQFSTMRWAWRRPAPRLGEHNDEALNPPSRRNPDRQSVLHACSARPLKDLHVLDFSWVWGGPFCTLQLAQLGADVIRIESARRSCLFRNLLPFADKTAGVNRAGLFNQVNQGKRSVVLELDNPRALEVARRMVRWADVVVENFAPGVLDRMGLGYEALRAIKPDLVMLSISGYGRSGPYRNYVSYGGIIGAHSGFYAQNG